MNNGLKTQHPGGLAKRTIVALWLWLATDILQALGCIWEIVTLRRLSEGEAARVIAGSADAPLTLAETLAIPYVTMSILAGVLILRWIYVVNRNAHRWTDAPLMSPGWNVGWFFVPVASLWKPYQGMRETWNATVNPAQPKTVTTPDFLRQWWWLWVATSLLGNLTFRLTLAADTRDELVTVDLLYVAAIFIDVPLTLMLHRLIQTLSAKQGERLTGEPPSN